MKKIKSFKEFVVGKIYNCVYVGNNEAYAKINGKRTFVVIATSPELRYQELFDQCGSVYSDEIRGNVMTSPNPEKAFTECNLYEVEDKSEWFVKSQFMTLQEALDEKLITLDEIKKSPNSRRLAGMDPSGFYIAYSVEGRSEKNPYLQRVFVKWDSRKEMDDDFKKFGAL